MATATAARSLHCGTPRLAAFLTLLALSARLASAAPSQQCENCKELVDDARLPIQCKEGYWRKGHHARCTKCADPGCCLGRDQYNRCTSCPATTGLTKLKSRCVPCKDVHCWDCSDDFSKCQDCFRGESGYNSEGIVGQYFNYYADQQGVCRQCIYTDWDEFDPLIRGLGCSTQGCDQAGRCLACPPGYRMDVKTWKCVQCMFGCLECSGTKCTKCDEEFRLVDKWCLPTCASDMSDGCQICDRATGSCQKCMKGYAMVSGDCQSCDPDNSGCLECTRPGSCLKCSTSQVLVNGKCQACPSGCETCSSPRVCTACDSGYFLAGNRCKECRGTSCDTCTPNGQRCLNCAEGHTLVNGICTACTQWGCERCAAGDPAKCLRCGTGFLRNNTCVDLLCSELVPKCEECTAVGNCRRCESGYTLTGPLCKRCPPGCTSCAPLGAGCKSCEEGHSLVNNKCLKCGLHCTKCDSQRCLRCEDGHGLVSGTCKRCTAFAGRYPGDGRCLNCDGNPAICQRCQHVGYEAKANRCFDKKECRAVDPNCSRCTAGRCTRCRPSFGLVSGRCKPCLDLGVCERCDGDVSRCTKCYSAMAYTDDPQDDCYLVQVTLQLDPKIGTCLVTGAVVESFLYC